MISLYRYHDMDRRKFTKYIAALGGTAVLTGVYIFQIEPFWLEIVHKNIKIENLPKGLVGKTIMQISDIHVGDRFDYQYIIDSFNQVAQLNPDFVVYTGDFVSWKNSKQLGQLQEVMQHTVKGKIGTAGILGNHDYGRAWSQDHVADDISQILTDSNITVLRNNQQSFEGLNIIGLDDYWGTNFQPNKVMSSIDNTKANLVLCHNPDVADLDIWQNYKGWILSGHTHGGQCKPPFLKPPILPVKNKNYSSGTYDLGDGRHMYINRALGHLWQMRFNVRPEITVFKLG